MARMKRSPNVRANWAFAIDRSRDETVCSFPDRFKIRQSSPGKSLERPWVSDGANCESHGRPQSWRFRMSRPSLLDHFSALDDPLHLGRAADPAGLHPGGRARREHPVPVGPLRYGQRQARGRCPRRAGPGPCPPLGHNPYREGKCIVRGWHMTDISPRTPCSNRSALQSVPLIGTKATADFHQGAQRSCSKSDAAYRAAAEITPASPEKPLPRRSHPYMHCINRLMKSRLRRPPPPYLASVA